MVKGFEKDNIGQLIMASGTGKTLVSLWISEEINTSSVLFLVPSISLMSQTVKEWSANAKENFRYLCLCSDKTVDDKILGDIKEYEIGGKVTTSELEVIDFVQKYSNEKIIIFSTYHSVMLTHP